MSEIVVKNDVLKGPIGKKMIKMSLSMMIGFLAGAAFNIVDTFYVSKLGTDALAAMGYTFPIVMIFFSIFIGIGVGVSAVISRTIGQGNSEKIKQITAHALILGVLIIALFSTIGFFFIDDFLRILGAEGTPFELAKSYMLIWLAGLSFLVIPILGNNAIRATGDTLTPSLIMVFDLGLNIILDPIFIFGWGPVPAMGIQGAALATVLCRMLAVPFTLSILVFRKKMLSVHSLHFKNMFKSWYAILQIGLPASFTNLLIPVSLGYTTKLISDTGIINIAAWGAGSKIENLAAIPFMALGSSCVPIIGQNLGAKLYERIKRCLKLAYFYCLIWGVIAFSILFLTKGLIAPIFTENPAVAEAIFIFLGIVPFTYGFKGMFFTSTSSLNALNKPIQSACLLITRFIIQISLISLGLYLYGYKGILWMIVLSEFLVAMIGIFWLWNVSRKWAVR